MRQRWRLPPPPRPQLTTPFGVVLVIDIDGTLAVHSSAADVSQWRELVERGQIDPVPEAVAHLGAPLPCRVVVVTNRIEQLRPQTEAWLTHHFPALDQAPLLMRGKGDQRGSLELRRDQVDSARGAGQAVVLVDDDPESRHALRNGDMYVQAPMGWRGLDWEMLDRLIL